MSVQLAFGVTNSPDARCWLPVPGGAPLPATDRAGAHPPGAPVAVGPADAAAGTVRDAVDRLTVLVDGGTETAAGAGVDLGGGFVSARLAGAPGDRRDAVLAALRFFGADRLGDRTAVLVALFGPAATKRVGAAAHAAMAEERWAALRLASAASDLLGPEQLEQVLALRAPDGLDPFPRGAASTLADHLARVLARYPRPRRLTLVVSLWDHVCERLRDRARLTRLAASQTGTDHLDRLRERHRAHFDEAILKQLRPSLGPDPTPAAAARWRPPVWWAAQELERLLYDAIAATALLRFTTTWSDEGLATAAARHRDELAAAAACLTKAERSAAARVPDGGYHHPARPGRYVHDLLHPLRRGRTFTAKTEAYVRERVAVARNYGLVILDAVTELIDDMLAQPLHNCHDACRPWQVPRLREWRAVAGFRRPPAGWEQPPLADANADGPKDTLARRIAADPAAEETPHDLLWYADLADALAPVYGHAAATVEYDRPAPYLRHDPAPPEPGHPPADSVPLAAAGVAQLVAFGATPPPRCGSWADLVAAVTADAVVAEASVGVFPLPPGMADVEGQVVPGTALTVELGRDPRKLAEWSGYMGNCIGQSWYAEDAERGDCVLMALRTDGRIVANLDIRGRVGGWRVNELLARFNEPLDPALKEHVTRWVGTLTPREPPPAAVAPEPPVRPRGGGAARGTRLPTALVRDLTAEATRALATRQVAAARRAYAGLAGNLGADFDPEAAVIALKRLGTVQYVALLHASLTGGQSAAALWRASGVRPLATAVAGVANDRVAALAGDAPLPRTLRALVRRPEIAPAYAMDVVARATRRAMGALLTDEALTRSVARRPTPELVCALVIATTCDSTVDATRLTTPGTTAVPGYPATDVLDEHGPWQRALPAAADLGTQVAAFDTAVAERGLHVPATLLGTGGWSALWHRAHR